MKIRSRYSDDAWGTLLFIATASGVIAAAPDVTVKHPNLLLNQAEIDQIKLKVCDHPWAARLLNRVKAKAEKDGAVLETALAYALTGESKYK